MKKLTIEQQNIMEALMGVLITQTGTVKKRQHRNYVEARSKGLIFMRDASCSTIQTVDEYANSRYQRAFTSPHLTKMLHGLSDINSTYQNMILDHWKELGLSISAYYRQLLTK